MVDITLSKETLRCIREPWSKALIVKVSISTLLLKSTNCES